MFFFFEHICNGVFYNLLIRSVQQIHPRNIALPIWTGTLQKYLESLSTYIEVKFLWLTGFCLYTPLKVYIMLSFRVLICCNRFLLVALGDDRRSFSYYKAIPVIEKLPFKIESVDQVKHLPTIGKSMQDHVSKQFYVHHLSQGF